MKNKKEFMKINAKNLAKNICMYFFEGCRWSALYEVFTIFKGLNFKTKSRLMLEVFFYIVVPYCLVCIIWRSFLSNSKKKKKK
jgi:hypothetical protein